jgi:hypothetical protein
MIEKSPTVPLDSYFTEHFSDLEEDNVDGDVFKDMNS